MNKYNFLLVLLLTINCNSAFAITDQIKLSNDLIEKLKPDVNLNDLADAPKQSIYPNQKSNAILLLKKQLNSEQSLKLNESTLYDEDLVNYINKFQDSKDFLQNTGYIDLPTWYALYNQNNNWKINILKSSVSELNNIYETLNKTNPDKFIIVNIPSMSLQAYNWNDGEPQIELYSNVIIGKVKTQTPLNNFSIWGIKYNPTWTPTKNIVKRNLYKNGTTNLKWINSHHLQVIDEDGNLVAPEDINSESSYKFLQPASDLNALGVLKFETSSHEDIYLHDTNEKSKFLLNNRMYSSGCIRVDDFKELAAFITNTDLDTINSNIDKDKTYTQKIKSTPVFFTYSQVLFIENNPVFFQDVYSKKSNTNIIK